MIFLYVFITAGSNIIDIYRRMWVHLFLDPPHHRNTLKFYLLQYYYPCYLFALDLLGKGNLIYSGNSG